MPENGTASVIPGSDTPAVARARRLIYQELVDELGLPVWRLPVGIAHDTGLPRSLVEQILESDPQILPSSRAIAGRTGYSLKPEAAKLLSR